MQESDLLTILASEGTVNPSNKIMVFLPGFAQIHQFYEILQRGLDFGWTESSFHCHFMVRALRSVLMRWGCRRSGLHIVTLVLPDHALCAQMAESGVTLPNVGLIIISGVQKRVSANIKTSSTVNALQTLSKAQLAQQQNRTGRTDQGVHITMMSHDQYTSQVRSTDLAQLEESDISPLILRSRSWSVIC